MKHIQTIQTTLGHFIKPERSSYPWNSIPSTHIFIHLLPASSQLSRNLSNTHPTPIPCKHIPSHPCIHPLFHPNNMKIHSTTQQTSPANIYATHISTNPSSARFCQHTAACQRCCSTCCFRSATRAALSIVSANFANVASRLSPRGLGRGACVSAFCQPSPMRGKNVGTQWGSLFKVVLQVAGKNCLYVSLDWSKGKTKQETPHN